MHNVCIAYLLLQSAEVELGGGVVVESEPPDLDHGELLPVGGLASESVVLGSPGDEFRDGGPLSIFLQFIRHLPQKAAHLGMVDVPRPGDIDHGI